MFQSTPLREGDAVQLPLRNVREVNLKALRGPGTKLVMNVGNPEEAFALVMNPTTPSGWRARSSSSTT